jgi:hypothetical protein
VAITFDATLGTPVTDTATLTTSSAAAAGSRVFVFIWWNELDGICTGMSAGGGLTWVVDHQYQVAFDTATCLAVLSADAPSGLASSTNLTPSFNTAPDFGPGIAAHSWTGVQTGASGYVDANTAGLQDFNETWATSSLTTTTANTLLFGISEGDSGTSNTAATDYTERHDWLAEGSHRVAVVSRVVTSASTYTPGGTWSTSVGYQMNFGIAYKEGVPAVVTPVTPGYTTFPKPKLRTLA